MADESVTLPARSNSNTKASWLRRLISKVLLVAFGLCFGCVIAEITLRVAHYSYPEFYQPDQTRGYALRPSKTGWYRKEGEAYVSINSDGLRDREHARAKPPDTVRIAVIGDSYAEAFQVPMEDSFWFLLETKLRECGAFGGKKTEVINFGVSGYGTAQELITLREHVWQYEPDVVLLAVTTNNDISDNVRTLKKSDDVPYFVFRGNSLVLDDSFKDTKAFRRRQSVLSRAGRWIHDHSRLIQAINQGQHGFKIWLASRRARAANTKQPEAATTLAASEELGIDNVIYREPNDDTWNNAWRVTEALISQMRDEVKAKGAKFVVVTLSNSIQVFPDSAGRASFMKKLGVNELFYPDNRIRKFCGSEGIAEIELAPRMLAHAEQHKVFLHGFPGNIGNGHWNQLGHRVAADLIATDICGGLLR